METSIESEGIVGYPKGARALVTGASRGIGKAIAEALGERGIQVYGTSRSPEKEEWAEGIVPVSLDLSSQERFEESWKAAGLDKVDFSIVINNAGFGVFSPFTETERDEWESQIELMLLAPTRICRLVTQRWPSGEGRAVVNVSSLAVEFPIPYMSGYNAAKAGLSAFTESLLLEERFEDACVVDLRPGDINTGFNEKMSAPLEGTRLRRALDRMNANVNAAPQPQQVARIVLKCLERRTRGTVRVGGFFQVKIASLFGRLISSSVKRAANLWYYNLGGK